MGLSEEVGKKDDDGPVCGGWKEVELHSTCAQSAWRVFKRLWKVQSVGRLLSCTLCLIGIVLFRWRVKSAI